MRRQGPDGGRADRQVFHAAAQVVGEVEERRGQCCTARAAHGLFTRRRSATFALHSELGQTGVDRQRIALQSQSPELEPLGGAIRNFRLVPQLNPHAREP